MCDEGRVIMAVIVGLVIIAVTCAFTEYNYRIACIQAGATLVDGNCTPKQ